MRQNLRNSLAAACSIAVACFDGAWAQAEPPCPATTSSSPFSSNAPVDEKLAPKLSPFVINGSDAAAETSTVRIESTEGNSSSSYLCSGTLIGTKRILTAAHCVCAACRMSVGFGSDMKSPTDK